MQLRERKKTVLMKTKLGIKENVHHQDFEANNRKISLLGQQTQAAAGGNSLMAERQKAVRRGNYPVGRDPFYPVGTLYALALEILPLGVPWGISPHGWEEAN